MEDLIYLVALIAWVAFAFYRKSQKKSGRTGEMPGNPQPQGRREALPTLEEILLGEEQTVPEPVPATVETWSEGMSPVLDETSFEKEYNLRGITSVEELDKPMKMDQAELSEIQKSEIGSEDKEIEEKWSVIDLRRAVIYSEILNRPYV